MACGTGFHLAAGLRARAVAFGAFLIAHQIDFLFTAAVSFVQRDGNIVAQIVARNRAVAAATRAAAKEAGENIVYIKPEAAAAAKAAEIAVAAAAAEALRAIVAELIVLRALLRIGKHLIGLVDLLKFFLRILIAGVDIWMVLFCQRAVRLFNCGFIRTLFNAQHLVIISLGCHMFPLLFLLRSEGAGDIPCPLGMNRYYSMVSISW